MARPDSFSSILHFCVRVYVCVRVRGINARQIVREKTNDKQSTKHIEERRKITLKIAWYPKEEARA